VRLTAVINIRAVFLETPTVWTPCPGVILIVLVIILEIDQRQVYLVIGFQGVKILFWSPLVIIVFEHVVRCHGFLSAYKFVLLRVERVLNSNPLRRLQRVLASTPTLMAR
jgi:hypothetical protein